MKRQEIYNLLTAKDLNHDDLEDAVKDVVDFFEARLQNIRDLLDIESIEDLNNIPEAYECAKQMADDLY